MTIYLTADQHFGHANIIHHSQRPFINQNEMDTVLAEAWNEVVQPDDTVYHLGDFCLGNEIMAANYFSRLNGRVKAIPGSHDIRWFEKAELLTASGYPVEYLPPFFTFDEDEYKITLCHYSMRTWPGSHYGGVHFFGHSHGRLKPHGRSMDVGVDAVGWKPIELKAGIQQILQNFNQYRQEKYNVNSAW